MKKKWNERYSSEKYAYGTAPNAFLKTVLESHNITGKILFPAEGEGRNAVFAAEKGLNVTAFDISEKGKEKALQLAQSKNVTINYKVGDFLAMDFSNNFNAVALIYAHFPPHLSPVYHKKITQLLDKNGWIIIEGFSKNNLSLREKNPKIGGPDNIEMLYSKERLQKDFPDFKIIQLKEVTTELKEGLYHNGMAKVIRFIGRKKGE